MSGTPGQLSIELADARLFADVALWRYEPPYDFYDGGQDAVENPERYFAARDEEGRVLGFYYFELAGGVLEIGLGLRPELTGQGLGHEFMRAGLEFGRERFAPTRTVLNVAAFNRRAITVYERLGFAERGRHLRSFERWGEVEFVEMEQRQAGSDARLS